MRIAAGQAREKGAHWRLMAAHQFAEGVLVRAQQDAGDEIGVGKGHTLWFGRLIVASILLFQQGNH